MNASEYIRKLQAIIDEHGDLPMTDSYDELVNDPEFNDDTVPCVLVCDKA